MKLQDVDGQGIASRPHNLGPLIDEQADHIDKRWNPLHQFGRALRRDVARTGRIEDETDRIGAGGNGGVDIDFAGEPADLDTGSHVSIPSRKSSSVIGKPQCDS